MPADTQKDMKQVNLSGFNLLLKRLIDLSVATVMLLFTAPLMAAIWLAVKFTSPGPGHLCATKNWPERESVQFI